MKIVVYGPDKRTGVQRDGSIVDISLAFAKYLREKSGERNPAEMAEALVSSDLLRFIEGGKGAIDNAQKAIDHLFGGADDQKGPRGEQLVFKAGEVKLHAPRARGARVACAGGNFADHAARMFERSAARGEMPGFTGDAREHIRKMGIWGFWKVDRESTPTEAEVIYPARAKRLDYEGELAIVLGKEGKDIPAKDIKNYIWGATLLGDWSVRLATEPGPLKFAMQKNFDTSCSIGPCIVVGEGLDALAADVETTVNGERRQKFNTKDMAFTFGEYLEHLSKDFTFYPGDMIASGTAAGTAADSSPLLPDGTPSDEKFLHPGDTVEIKNPVIGTLRNKVVAKRNR
jgi:2-keto-4-pentenoate hydratase/2-oxohepta-3-ene-1,7-dioic acid hydratase in catechol pathway